MNKIGSEYAASYYRSAASQMQQNSKETDSRKADGTGKTKQTDKAGQPRLSEKAQALLEKLRKTYDNMDFMVADFEEGDEARGILSRGTKEFSVLFSSDELEKMASDESYEQECVEKIQDAVHMARQINEEYNKGGGQNNISRVGISFHKDGSVTYFAEVQESLDKQKERIEESREKSAEEKKAAQKKESLEKEDAFPAKRVTVQASSKEELLEKIYEIDFSKVKEEVAEGAKIDFSV